MPLYEYRCDHCGKHFDALQKFSDDPLTVHPECGSGPVERLISPPAFHFKGSGWYVTDYAKSGGNSSPHKTEGSGEGKGEGKSEGEGKASEGKSSEGKSSEGKSSDSKSSDSKGSESAPAPTSSDSKT